MELNMKSGSFDELKAFLKIILNHSQGVTKVKLEVIKHTDQLDYFTVSPSVIKYPKSKSTSQRDKLNIFLKYKGVNLYKFGKTQETKFTKTFKEIFSQSIYT